MARKKGGLALLLLALLGIAAAGGKKEDDDKPPPPPRERDLFVQCSETSQTTVEFTTLFEHDRNDSSYLKLISLNSLECPNPNFVPKAIECGPRPPAQFHSGAGYWWDPVRRAVGWFDRLETQPSQTSVIAFNEGFNQTLQNWYKCDQLAMAEPDPLGFLREYVN